MTNQGTVTRLAAVITLLSFLSFSGAFATEIYFFHAAGCPHCAQVINSGVVSKAALDYNVSIISYDVASNYDGYLLYKDTITRLNTGDGVPLVYFNCSGGETYLRGADSIIDNMDSVTSACLSGEHVAPGENWGITNPYNELTIPVILAAALIDSINPCAFAVMIFLLSTLINTGERRKILSIGFAYIAAVYVTYLMAGIGIFRAIQQFTQITYYIYYAAAFIAIGAGVLSLRDFFSKEKEFVLKIPKSEKKTIGKWARKGTLPAALVLGFLVSMFELPCTGGVYLAILSLLAKSATNGFLYLILYNLIFVSPLVVILFLVYKGSKTDRLEKWRESKRNWMKLVAGLFMLALGIGMIFGWF